MSVCVRKQKSHRKIVNRFLDRPFVDFPFAAPHFRDKTYDGICKGGDKDTNQSRHRQMKITLGNMLIIPNKEAKQHK